jgi:hypothetical protein
MKTQTHRFSRARRGTAALCILALVAGSEAQDTSADGVAVIDGLMWALTMSALVPWSEAEEFCDTLRLGGFDDWRLPLLAELESLHDPEAPGSIRAPLELDDCCAWSSLNLTDLEAERKGVLPDPGGPPEQYYWGFLFDGGVTYYSNGRFDDGFALCLRTPD